MMAVKLSPRSLEESSRADRAIAMKEVAEEEEVMIEVEEAEVVKTAAVMEVRAVAVEAVEETEKEAVAVEEANTVVNEEAVEAVVAVRETKV